MSNVYGNQLSIKRESVWGTPVVPDKSIPINPEGGINTDNDTQLISSVQAKLAKNYCAIIGNRVHEGDLTMDLFADYPGYFWLTALGSVASALKGGETIVYEHTFTEAETKPSLTIEQVIGENVRRFAGSIAHTIKVSVASGETIKMTPSIKAKSQASATKITYAGLATCPFNFSQVQVKIGGSTLAEVENIEMEYTNGLDLLHTLNSNDPAFKYLQGSEVTGTIEAYLNTNSMVELNNYLAKTERSLEILITGESIGLASNYEWKFTIPRAVFTTGTTELADDYNKVSLEFAGLYDSVSAKLCELKITNLLTDYT